MAAVRIGGGGGVRAEARGVDGGASDGGGVGHGVRMTLRWRVDGGGEQQHEEDGATDAEHGEPDLDPQCAEHEEKVVRGHLRPGKMVDFRTLIKGEKQH